MALITLPDGSVKEIADGSSVMQLAETIGRRLAEAAIAGKVDGKVVDLSTPLSGDHSVSILTERDPESLVVLRHSSAHVMAQALRQVFGDKVQYTIGPVIENGFYYDVEIPGGIKTEDLPRVEEAMQRIIDMKLPFSRTDVTPDNAKERMAERSQRFKGEIIDDLVKAGETQVSLYEQGDFLDLCRGPHIPHTGKIKAFKLMKIAGAYWRADATREQLTRIYGIAFLEKKQLDAHLTMLSEAEKRDHRVLGPLLGLFTIDDAVGQGLVLWKPKGAIIRQELQNFISEHLRRQGYQQVFTPHIGRLGLYRTSGHYPYYRESQFPPLVDSEVIAKLAAEKCSCADLANLMEKGEVDGYLLKPMNCPMHIKIYESEQRSYRDLPIRLAEFGTVYRWEKSGELGGMTRVRGFTQDDAHLFCTEEQVAKEIQGCLDLVKIVLGTLGMKDYRVRVSLRDPDSSKYVGGSEQWEKAEKACKDAAVSMGVPFTLEPGEAAFYGPKIDFIVRDVIGREWQLGTVQVDYQLPQRFELTYVGQDNRPHTPVMIHRAPFGSMERFIGVLTEHFGGAFPMWLAPVQVAVLSISEKSLAFATEVTETLKQKDVRVELDAGAEKIGAKIRNHTMRKTPLMLVIGEQEAAAHSVSVRPYHDVEGAIKGSLSLDDFVEQVKAKIASKWHPSL